jgi:hypothetical protein
MRLIVVDVEAYTHTVWTTTRVTETKYIATPTAPLLLHYNHRRTIVTSTPLYSLSECNKCDDKDIPFTIVLSPDKQQQEQPLEEKEQCMTKSRKKSPLATEQDLNHKQRRQFLKHTGSTLVSVYTAVITTTASPCYANDNAINRRSPMAELITTSDLGVAVRRSVVRGAQIIDHMDLQAEKFSDTYQLGSERSKQSSQKEFVQAQAKRTIPPLQPFNTKLARLIIQCMDNVFCTITKITPSTLQQQIQLVTEKVQPSFVRSGVKQISVPTPTDENSATRNNSHPTIAIVVVDDAAQFNFLLYVHYKSYIDVWIAQYGSTSTPTTAIFTNFRTAYQTRIGTELLTLLGLPYASRTASRTTSAITTSTSTVISNETRNKQEQAFYDALRRIDDLSTALVSNGFVAQMDRTPFEATNGNDNSLALDVADWSQQLSSDLSWSIALDNDITLSAQILLQEQGIRLYPNYIRCMVQAILQQALEVPYHQRIVTEDYYLDTDYNSDPDKFEVKQVLININIENML